MQVVRFARLLNSGGVIIRFNNDTMGTTLRGWGYDTRTIWAYLERHDTIQ